MQRPTDPIRARMYDFAQILEDGDCEVRLVQARPTMMGNVTEFNVALEVSDRTSGFLVTIR